MSLPLWVEFFDDLQQVRGRSRNTVMAYRRDLELFSEYRSTTTHLHGFFHFLKKKKLSARSQARVISCVRTYLRFCETHGLKTPELRELKLPKVNNKLPRLLTINEYYKLIDASKCENPFKSARNQITLLMLFGLGCRVSELIQLNLQDFHADERCVSITGKGGKQRLIPLTENLYQELTIYLSHIRPQLLKSKNTPSLILNERGQRPSRVDIWRWLSAWSEKAGFKDVIHPHQFRHGCATSLLEAGADLRSIQLLLGHASIQTTQIYTSVTKRVLEETIEEHHPLSKLKSLS